MGKFSAKWVRKCLNADQKRQRCQTSEQIWNFFGAIQMISCRARLVTMNETWLCHYDPETKQQSMEWRHSGSSHPKKFRVQKSAGKFLASIFWDQDGILLIDYLPKGQTINAEYYLSLLLQLKDILKEKRRGNFTMGSCFTWQFPGSPGTFNPEETGLPEVPVSWAPTLFFGSGPVGIPPVSWTEKAIERSSLFFLSGGHCCLGDLVGRKIFFF